MLNEIMRTLIDTLLVATLQPSRRDLPAHRRSRADPTIGSVHGHEKAGGTIGSAGFFRTFRPREWPREDQAAAAFLPASGTSEIVFRRARRSGRGRPCEFGRRSSR